MTPITERFKAELESIQSQISGADKTDLSHLKNEFTNLQAAIKQTASEQKTLTQSKALSNNIQTWMQNNTKAAERFGTELTDLQSQLNGNRNASTLRDVSLQFREIQSNAKAAGLTTSSFATSLKNVALQLTGLTSAVAVVQKVISTIK